MSTKGAAENRAVGGAAADGRESLLARVKFRIRHDLLHLLVNWRWLLRSRRRRPHGLEKPLILSLTSFPARFPVLPLTLKCLLSQTVKPDKVILWIATADRDQIPPSVSTFCQHGLTIEYCEDARSFNKIIPTLESHPDVFLATADDDTYYWPTWLEELTNGHDQTNPAVVCHRMHRILQANDGLPLPYDKWELNSASNGASLLHFLTGVGGVLYPPGCFHADVTRRDLFTLLTPKNDDVWLYWMLLLNQFRTRKVGVVRALMSWRSSQDIGLWKDNFSGQKNDEQIGRMIAKYGFPLDTP